MTLDSRCTGVVGALDAGERVEAFDMALSGTRDIRGVIAGDSGDFGRAARLSVLLLRWAKWRTLPTDEEGPCPRVQVGSLFGSPPETSFHRLLML